MIPNPSRASILLPLRVSPYSTGSRALVLVENFCWLSLSLLRPLGYWYQMNVFNEVNKCPYQHCYWLQLHRIRMRSSKYKYQNALSSFQCIAAFFCFVHLRVILCVIQYCLLLLQYIIIMLIPMQQHHEPYQANSFPSHHILLCPNATTSCSVLSFW